MIRWVLIAAAGLAVVAVVAGTLALTGGGSSTGTAQTRTMAQLPAPQPAAPNPGKPKADTNGPITIAAPTMIEKTGEPAKPKPHQTQAPSVVSSGTCEASYYEGVPYHGSNLVSAHKTLPFGTRVRVTNENNGQSVTVYISDRGPFVAGRCLDLSNAAMAAIGGMGSGVVPVRYAVLG